MTDGFELLIEDHRRVEQLFDTYSADDAAGSARVREIADALSVHTEAEEAALYPELRRLVDGGDDLADEAEAEHGAVRAIVGRIELSPPEDLSGLVEEMRELVSRHVQKEESSVFPAMREAGVDAEALGRRVEEVKHATEARLSEVQP